MNLAFDLDGEEDPRGHAVTSNSASYLFQLIQEEDPDTVIIPREWFARRGTHEMSSPKVRMRVGIRRNNLVFSTNGLHV